MGNLPMKITPPDPQESENYGSQITINPSVWNWPDAKPGPRIIAFVIDSLIVTAAATFLGVLLNPHGDTPSLLRAVLLTVYYCFFHSRTGQTLGKKMVGIRVVTLEQDSGGGEIPLGRIVLRETVGRILNVVPCFLGYFFVLFKDDHMGFHDKISRTRVVSLTENRGFQFQIKYLVIGLVVMLVGVVAAGLYMGRYTAFPLRELATKLTESGFTFEKIDGSFARGFSIEAMTYESDELRVELQGVSFGATLLNENAEKGAAERQLKIADLVVQSGRIIVKKIPDAMKTTVALAKKEPEGPFGAESTHRALPHLPELVTLNAADMNQIEVQIPGRPHYHMHRLFLSGLEIHALANTTSLARLYIDSDALSANFEDILAQQKRISFGKQAVLQLRPALDPEIIASPIDIQFEGFFENGKPTSLKLTAFRNALHAKWFASSGEVVVNDLTLLNYLKTELPLWKMNFKVAMDDKHVKIEQLQGSVGVRNVQFNMDALSFVYQRGSKKFTLAPRLSADWKSMLAGRDPGFVLGSSDRQTAREVLTEIYFARPPAALTAQERVMLDKDVHFFADTVDAGTAPPPTIHLVEAPVVKARQPTSAKLPVRLTSSAKSQLPTQLPPYRAKRKN